MHTSIQSTLNLLQMRTDYAGAEVSMGEEGPYIKAQFRLRNGALSNELIIDLMVASGGAILRVCDLGIGKVPLRIDGDALCEFLNWKREMGRFLCVSNSNQSIWYMAHQFLDNDRIPASALNRMIDEALLAGLLSEEVLKVAAEIIAEQAATGENFVVSPAALN